MRRNVTEVFSPEGNVPRDFIEDGNPTPVTALDDSPSITESGPLVDSPEVLALGMSAEDAQSLDDTLGCLARVDLLTERQRDIVGELLIGYALMGQAMARDFGGVDVCDAVMARIAARRAS